MGNSVHLDLDGDGDLLLDFLGRPSRPLRDHLHPRVRHVGIRLDRQVVERDHAPNEEKQSRTEHNEAVVQSEIEECANHCCSAVFWNSSAFATTCWPGEIPETTSCM